MVDVAEVAGAGADEAHGGDLHLSVVEDHCVVGDAAQLACPSRIRRPVAQTRETLAAEPVVGESATDDHGGDSATCLAKVIVVVIQHVALSLHPERQEQRVVGHLAATGPEARLGGGEGRVRRGGRGVGGVVGWGHDGGARGCHVVVVSVCVGEADHPHHIVDLLL